MACYTTGINIISIAGGKKKKKKKAWHRCCRQHQQMAPAPSWHQRNGKARKHGNIAASL